MDDGTCFKKMRVIMTETETTDYGFQNDDTIVQVVDSSNRNSTKNLTDSLHQECEMGREINIVHIPETHEIVQNCNKTGNNASGKVPSILCQNTVVDENNTPTMSSTTEMHDIDESVDLDLIVQTYEVLLSSKDAELLIANWLTESGLQQQKAHDENDFTLEENLKRFITYCSSRTI